VALTPFLSKHGIIETVLPDGKKKRYCCQQKLLLEHLGIEQSPATGHMSDCRWLVNKRHQTGKRKICDVTFQATAFRLVIHKKMILMKIKFEDKIVFECILRKIEF
jgi:hypothetical protein